MSLGIYNILQKKKIYQKVTKDRRNFMVKNLDQLKALISWCKDQKLKKLKLGDIEFEISELDFIPDEGRPLEGLKANTEEYNTETLADTLDEPKDWRDDPDLYHSSN